MFTESAKWPFVAEIVLLTVFISHKFIVLFVNCVIGQVHKFILLVDFLSVCLWCESCKAFLMHVDSERLVRCYYNINPKIEFVAIDKQWVCDVLRNDWGLVDINVVDIVN